MSGLINMYNIRDNIIPSGNTEELSKYLDNNIFLENNIVSNIETFYGSAISANNILMISLLNLFVRENNIKINKSNVIREIYYADCRHDYEKQLKLYSSRIEFGSFSGEIREEYISKYWNIFNK